MRTAANVLFEHWIKERVGSFRRASVDQLVQDIVGRIRAVPIGVEPRAIQNSVGQILAAEKDPDFRIGQRHRTKPVGLLV